MTPLTGFLSNRGVCNKCPLLIRQAAVFMFLLPQWTLCTAWAVLGLEKPHYNNDAQQRHLIIQCAGASLAWGVCALTYTALLAGICFYLTTRKPMVYSSSVENKYISFSILFTFLVCLAFVPANRSTDGRFSTATKTFAIIVIAYGFLVSIFAPKCYSVLKKYTYN